MCALLFVDVYVQTPYGPSPAVEGHLQHCLLYLGYDTSPETSLRGSLVQREFFPRGKSVRFELSDPGFFEFISVLTGPPGFPAFPEQTL